MTSINEYESAYIALGTNISTEKHAPRAIAQLALTEINRKLTISAQSNLYQTPCFPEGAGPDYLNAVMCVSFKGESSDLLHTLHRIETSFGRTRNRRWEARTLDLDLLAFGSQIAPSLSEFEFWRELPLEDQKTRTPQTMILPHPRIQDRAFVLGPWMDIAPNWTHPVTGQTVAQMWEALPAHTRAEIVKV